MEKHGLPPTNLRGGSSGLRGGLSGLLLGRLLRLELRHGHTTNVAVAVQILTSGSLGRIVGLGGNVAKQTSCAKKAVNGDSPERSLHHCMAQVASSAHMRTHSTGSQGSRENACVAEKRKKRPASVAVPSRGRGKRTQDTRHARARVLPTLKHHASAPNDASGTCDTHRSQGTFLAEHS